MGFGIWNLMKYNISMKKIYKLKDLPIEINRNHFWSYDKEKATLSAEIIIEHILKYGTLEEIFILSLTLYLRMSKKHTSRII